MCSSDLIATRREDHEWIAEQRRNAESLYVPVWRNRNLVAGMEGGSPEAVYIAGGAAEAHQLLGGFAGVAFERE